MKELSLSELEIGMVLARDVYDPYRNHLLPEGTTINEEVLKILNTLSIAKFYVEGNVPAGTDRGPDEPSYAERVKASPEFQAFKQSYELQLDSFRQVINNVVEQNTRLDIKSLLQQSLEIATLGQDKTDLLTMLQNMKEYDDSTYAHCLNVALLCNLFAGWLHYSQERIELTTTCGLFHDLGKLLVPHEILTKPAKLTENEYEAVQKHPIDGYCLLMNSGINVHVQNAVLMHHERMDGSGYPLQKKGDEIDKYARIVAIADVYDAMTAVRVYRDAMCPFKVIEVFESEGFEKYDVEFLPVILGNIANTYIQHRCRLSDGREGTIIYINPEKLSRPTIQCGDQYVKLAEFSDLKVEKLL